jgi:hypothetical protein
MDELELKLLGGYACVEIESLRELDELEGMKIPLVKVGGCMDVESITFTLSGETLEDG